MKFKKMSMRALSYLLTILMITGCLALPMSVGAAEANVTVSIKAGGEGFGSITINGEDVTSGVYNVGDEVTIKATPNESERPNIFRYVLKQWDDGTTDLEKTFTIEEGQTYNFEAEFAKQYYTKYFAHQTGAAVGGGLTVTPLQEYAFVGEEVSYDVVDTMTTTGHSVADSVYHKGYPLRPGEDYTIEYITNDHAIITIKDFQPEPYENSYYYTYGLYGSSDSGNYIGNCLQVGVDGKQVKNGTGLTVTLDKDQKPSNSTAVFTVTKQNDGYEFLREFGHTNSTSNFFSVYVNGTLTETPEYEYFVEDIDENTRKVYMYGAYSSGRYRVFQFNATEKKATANIECYDIDTGEKVGTVTKEILLGSESTIPASVVNRGTTATLKTYKVMYWDDDPSKTEYAIDRNVIENGSTINIKANVQKAKVTINVHSSNEELGMAYINNDKNISSITVNAGEDVLINAEPIAIATSEPGGGGGEEWD